MLTRVVHSAVGQNSSGRSTDASRRGTGPIAVRRVRVYDVFPNAAAAANSQYVANGVRIPRAIFGREQGFVPTEEIIARRRSSTIAYPRSFLISISRDFNDATR